MPHRQSSIVVWQASSSRSWLSEVNSINSEGPRSQEVSEIDVPRIVRNSNIDLADVLTVRNSDLWHKDRRISAQIAGLRRGWERAFG